MSLRGKAFVVVALAAVAVAVVPAAHAKTPLSAIDHFKCYKAAESAVPPAPGIPAAVRLSDQFGNANLQVGKVVRLCNPVRKLHDGRAFEIRHPDLHLVCYAIRQNVPRQVQVRNQFGIRQLNVTRANRLCLPSYKNETPQGQELEPLANLDHYKCYQAREPGAGAPGIPNIVNLLDQFGANNVFVDEPTTLCNPTRKGHDGVITRVRFADLHLTCFAIRQPGDNQDRSVFVLNQFQRRDLTVTTPMELCLPSYKRVLAAN